MDKYFIKIFNFLLFLILCFCITYWVIESSRETKNFDYLIAEKNIKNPDTKIFSSNMFGIIPSVSNIDNIKLSGIIYSNKEKDRLAIIIDNGKTKYIKEGYKLNNETYVIKIKKDRIYVSASGLEKEIVMPKIFE